MHLHEHKKPRISVAKVTAPTSDAGKFDFSIGGTGFDNSGAGYGNGQNTGFQEVSVGGVTVSESAHAGTTLSNYTSTLACINAADQAVTVSSNTGTSGSVTVAAGDDIRCTFTNARKPELRVVKADGSNKRCRQVRFSRSVLPASTTAEPDTGTGRERRSSLSQPAPL